MNGTRRDVIIWAVLMLLLGLNFAVSYARWGSWSTGLSYSLSAAMAALIAYFYMHLREERGMTRIFALAGVAWLVVMFSLITADYISRGWIPFPAHWPVLVKLKPSLNDDYSPDEKQPPRPGGFGIGR